MWTVSKVFSELVTILFLFFVCVCVFWLRGVWGLCSPECSGDGQWRCRRVQACSPHCMTGQLIQDDAVGAVESGFIQRLADREGGRLASQEPSSPSQNAGFYTQRGWSEGLV